jgi:acetyl-CoA carboxylase alpha subunit
MSQILRDHLTKNLVNLKQKSAAERLKQRYEKFRAYGQFSEPSPKAA